MAKQDMENDGDDIYQPLYQNSVSNLQMTKTLGVCPAGCYSISDLLYCSRTGIHQDPSSVQPVQSHHL